MSRKLHSERARRVVLGVAGLVVLHGLLAATGWDVGTNVALALANLFALLRGMELLGLGGPRRGLIFAAGYAGLAALLIGGAGSPLLFVIFAFLYGGTFHVPLLLGYVLILMLSIVFISPYWFQVAVLMAIPYTIAYQVRQGAGDRFIRGAFALGFLLLAAVVFPIFYLAFESAPQTLIETARESDFQAALATTFWTATATTLLVLILGVPAAYAMARLEFRGKEVLDSLIDLPLLIPQPVVGIALMVVFGSKTPLGQFLESRIGFTVPGSYLGIIACQVFVSSPFLIRATLNAFLQMDEKLERVSRTLGAPPLVTFFRISLPIAIPAIFTGGILTWARAVSETGSLMIIAYRPLTIGTLSFDTFSQYGLEEARPVAVLLVLACLWTFVALRWLRSSIATRSARRRPETARRMWPSGELPAGAGAAFQPAGSVTPSAVPGENFTWTFPRVGESLPAALEVHGLRRRWGSFALRDISLQVGPREYCVILGPSGSGKTLLLETLAGLHLPERGQVLLGNQDATRWPPERRRVGIVYQNYHLFPHLSPRENVAYGLRYLGLSQAARQERVGQVMDALGIGYLLARRSVQGLSGGEMQKVALARALVIEPRLLLLDEPLGPLDYPSRESVFNLLGKVKENLDIPVLHVTHDYTEALVLADKIAVLFDGRIVQVGSAREVFWHPSTPEVARFLGVPNVVPAFLTPAYNGTCWVTLGTQRLLATGCPGEGERPVKICIRPEDIAPVALETPGDNVLYGRLVELSDRGFSLKAGIDMDGIPLFCALSHHQLHALHWQVGDRVAVTISPERIHVLEERR